MRKCGSPKDVFAQCGSARDVFAQLRKCERRFCATAECERRFCATAECERRFCATAAALRAFLWLRRPLKSAQPASPSAKFFAALSPPMAHARGSKTLHCNAKFEFCTRAPIFWGAGGGPHNPSGPHLVRGATPMPDLHLDLRLTGLPPSLLPLEEGFASPPPVTAMAAPTAHPSSLPPGTFSSLPLSPLPSLPPSPLPSHGNAPLRATAARAPAFSAAPEAPLRATAARAPAFSAAPEAPLRATAARAPAFSAAPEAPRSAQPASPFPATPPLAPPRATPSPPRARRTRSRVYRGAFADYRPAPPAVIDPSIFPDDGPVHYPRVRRARGPLPAARRQLRRRLRATVAAPYPWGPLRVRRARARRPSPLCFQ